MLELLAILGLVFVGLAMLAGLFKLIIVLIILPIKLAFFLVKGVVGLVFIIPLAIILYVVFANAFPIILLVMVLPVLAVFAGLALLLKLVFC